MAVPSALRTLALAAALAAAPLTPAAFATAAPRVVVDVRVQQDGSIDVTDTTTFTGGGGTVRRTLPVRVAFDDTYEQVYEVEDVSASSGTVARTPGAGTTTLSAATRTSSLTLRYTVRGAVRATAEGLEMAWPAVQAGEDVDRLEVRVRAPAVSWAACLAGPADSSRPCTATQAGGARAVFEQAGLPGGARMTVIVGMPATTATQPSARLARPWSPAAGFAATPVSAGLALAFVALASIGVLVLWRTRGRDRPPHAAPPTAAPLEPPDGVQPGQLGTVVNEHADVVDVVATVLDLAVRGHVEIEATDAGWTLRRPPEAGGSLHAYERVLLDQVPSAATSLADAAERMRRGLPAVQDALYADVVANGWFVERPDAARGRWATAGIVLAAAGVVVTAVLAAAAGLGLAGLGLVASGAILGWGGQVAPARSDRGSGLLLRLHEFRESLATTDPDTLAAADAERLLPFAVVFGLEDRFMAAAAASAALPTRLPQFVTALSGAISARRVRI